MAWHLVGGEETGAYRFRLDGSNGSAEVLLLPLDDNGQVEVLEHTVGLSGLHLAHRGISPLRAVTVFLAGPWMGAEAKKSISGLELRRTDTPATLLSIPLR